jgi:hypothetical protein
MDPHANKILYIGSNENRATVVQGYCIKNSIFEIGMVGLAGSFQVSIGAWQYGKK